MEREKAEGISEELSGKLADLLNRHDGAAVTKWLALVEVIDPEGQRGLWILLQDGLKSWDTMGMLLYTLEQEAGDIHHPWSGSD